MKVAYFPYQPHSFAFGGFEYQMLNAFKSIQINSETEVTKFDLWKKKMDYDILHLWGITEHNFHIIDYCQKNNKKIYATVLLPYYDSSKELLSHKFYSFYPNIYKSILRYFQKINHFSVVNEIQLDILNRLYGISKDKISIIPNIVDSHFYTKETYYNSYLSQKKYALTTGNICRRKNQLEIAKIFEKLNYNLVVIGSVLDGEEMYGSQFKKFVENSNHITWIKSLENTDSEYLELYFNCTFFILGSKIETQPISILEAIVMEKPVIALDCAYTRQKVFSNVIKVKSIDEQSIRNAIESTKNVTTYNQDFLLQFKIENIGELYRISYLKLLNS
jgi:glycosyltransferase involved in cell wall biosynthesis